ncbi:MAG: glycosyltransferase WbuB [Planctomycetia bacterium]|nr:glycosyltransferase WbuB [Planctomycetia bacterium]
MSRVEPLPPPLSIWLVNPFDDIPGEGLPPMRYWSLARVLAGRGHDVTWWTATWSHRRKARRDVPLGIRDDENFAVRLVAVRPYDKNVSLARIGSHRDFGVTFERLAAEAVASGGLERPDLILASLPPLEGPEAAARLARRLDAAFVCDVMDAWPETFARLLPGPGWLRRLLAPFLLGGMETRRDAVLARADAVSAQSRSLLDLARTHLPAEREAEVPTHVCPLGAYLQDYPEPPRPAPAEIDALRLAGGEDARPIRCVYAGSLEVGQDLDTLVAAARLLFSAGVNAEIHVAGTGSLEGRLRRGAAGLTGSCRITVHGLLGRRDYVALLATADVGLVLVRPETLVAVPYKACDYAAAGLALVNSLPGELERLVAEHDAGLTYAKAIATFAADRGLLRACRQGSRRLAAAVFDRETTYLHFAKWLEACASHAVDRP